MSLKVLGLFVALVVMAQSATVPLYLSPTTTTLLRSAPLWDTTYLANPYYSVIPSYRHIVYVQPEPRYITVQPPTLVQEIGKSPVLTFGAPQGPPQVNPIVPVEVESPADDVEKVTADEDTVSVESA